MKRITLTAVVFILMLTLCACGKSGNQDNLGVVPSGADIDAEEDYINFYVPADDESGFEKQSHLCKYTGRSIVSKLVDLGALPQGSGLVSMKFVSTPEGIISRIQVNMNEDFEKGLKKAGKKDSYLYLGSLVNTLLEYVGVDELQLSVCGKAYHTDYDIGDGELTWFNDSI